MQSATIHLYADVTVIYSCASSLVQVVEELQTTFQRTEECKLQRSINAFFWDGSCCYCCYCCMLKFCNVLIVAAFLARSPLKKRLWGLPGGTVVKGSGFAPRLCCNRPRPGGPWGHAQLT